MEFGLGFSRGLWGGTIWIVDALYVRPKWSTIAKGTPAPTKQAAFHNQPSRITAWGLFVFRRVMLTAL